MKGGGFPSLFITHNNIGDGDMTNDIIIKFKNITVSFSGNRALKNIDFDLRKQEIHCLCGENGAGKSTLIKALSGAVKPESGEIHIFNKKYHELHPQIAIHLGIHTIYQENLLIPDMTVAENIFVGEEKCNRYNLIDYQSLYKETADILDRLKAPISPKDIVKDLSMGNQQYIKIARALIFQPRILIMDEPTTMFNSVDADKLLDIVRTLRDDGMSIIYITHKMEEIEKIADRVTVLRDGEVINCYDRYNGGIDLSHITTDMVGRPIDLFYQKERVHIGETVMEVTDLLVSPTAPPVSFSVHRGEILGFAGMVGSGRTEIMQALYGYKPKAGGEIKINGKKVDIRSPKDALKNGICLITEDRQKTGVILDMPITPNITLPSLNKLKGFFLRLKEEKTEAMEMAKRVNLKALNMHAEVRTLSGGNQQKVVVGKWLYKNAKIFVFDEPTRGIDVNAKAEIYALMVEMVKQGKSIIMVSSDMPELISISDRVLVIKNQSINAELTGADIDEQHIIVKTL